MSTKNLYPLCLENRTAAVLFGDDEGTFVSSPHRRGRGSGSWTEEEIALERVLRQLQRNVPMVRQENESDLPHGSAVLLRVLH